MLHFCHLRVPTCARVKTRITAAECNNTKKIVNLKVRIVRAICHIKKCQILKTTLPITMLHHADDIIHVFAALRNLKLQHIANFKHSEIILN